MALDMTSADALLKEIYRDDVMKNLTYQKRPFLAMVPKDENFVGDAMPIPLTVGNPQGRSATIGDALDNVGNSTHGKFVVTHVRNYSIVSIDNLTIMASASKKGGFAEALTTEINNGISSLANNVACDLFRNGGGAIGRVGSSAATSISLKDTNDVVNFEKGMEIEVAATDGTSGSLRTGTVTVTHVNRDSGVITTDATSAIGNLADDDYIFQEGDFNGKLKGLAAWVPLTAPTSGDSFFSLDRSVDTVRYAGVRIASTDVAGLPLEEKLLFACNRLEREGGMPDTVFVSHEKFRDLQVDLASRLVYEDVKGANFGFKAITISGAYGSVKVMPDRWCPNDKAYILTMDSWKLCTTGPAVQILDRDGKLLRESSSDAYQCRIAFYGNLTCKAPGWNAVVDLS